jgi:hypothetical protein
MARPKKGIWRLELEDCEIITNNNDLTFLQGKVGKRGWISVLAKEKKGPLLP